MDGDRRLLGTISVDDVIDVIREEATEDIQRLAGVPGDETVLDPPRAVFTKRLLWRLINLGTAVLAASVIGLFEGSIQSAGHPRDLHADRGLDGGHRDHPDGHRGGPGHRAGGHDGRRPDAGAPQGGMLGLTTGVANGLILAVIAYLWKGRLAAGVHPRPGPGLQHDRGGGRGHAGAHRAEDVPGRPGHRVQRDHHDIHGRLSGSFRFWASRPSSSASCYSLTEPLGNRPERAGKIHPAIGLPGLPTGLESKPLEGRTWT